MGLNWEYYPSNKFTKTTLCTHVNRVRQVTLARASNHSQQRPLSRSKSNKYCICWKTYSSKASLNRSKPLARCLCNNDTSYALQCSNQVVCPKTTFDSHRMCVQSPFHQRSKRQLRSLIAQGIGCLPSLNGDEEAAMQGMPGAQWDTITCTHRFT
jgi:hypothetical protein